MDDLPKVGEKLLIVTEIGTKLLYALHNLKNAYATDGLRPVILSDSNLQPFYKAILKRFPDSGGLSQVDWNSLFGFSFISPHSEQIYLPSISFFLSFLFVLGGVLYFRRKELKTLMQIANLLLNHWERLLKSWLGLLTFVMGLFMFWEIAIGL